MNHKDLENFYQMQNNNNLAKQTLLEAISRNKKIITFCISYIITMVTIFIISILLFK